MVKTLKRMLLVAGLAGAGCWVALPRVEAADRVI